MIRHVGILAHSADGAALCFVEACREGARRLGAHHHPEITLSILAMGPILDAWRSGDLATVGDHLARSAARLAAAGCDFFACADNTDALLVTPDVSPLPTLDSTRLLAREAVAVAIGAAELPSWRGGPP